MSRKLTPRQEKFCREYVKDYNATQAAIRAGYAKRSAKNHAVRLMANDTVSEKVKALTQKDADNDEELRARVILELRRLAFQDIRDMHDENGNLIPVHELSDDAAATVAGIKVRKLQGKTAGQLVEIKRESKTKALEMLAKHLGVTQPDLNIGGINVTISAQDSKLV